MISRQKPLLESHDLYGLAASICVRELDLRAARSREMLFDHLWSLWPKETRGPVADPDSDEDAAWAARIMPADEIAERLQVSEKAAKAKIRRGQHLNAQWHVYLYRGSRREDRPWFAGAPAEWGVYVITGERAQWALDGADPELILSRPDVDLWKARRWLERAIAEPRTRATASIEMQILEELDERGAVNRLVPRDAPRLDLLRALQGQKHPLPDGAPEKHQDLVRWWYAVDFVIKEAMAARYERCLEPRTLRLHRTEYGGVLASWTATFETVPASSYQRISLEGLRAALRAQGSERLRDVTPAARAPRGRLGPRTW